MERALFEAIYQYPSLSETERSAIMEAHCRVSFERCQEILREGHRSNAYYLLETGVARAFVNDRRGRECTTQFFGPNTILIEEASLFQRIPARSNLQALTDITAWKIEFGDFQELFHSIEGFREWGRAWMVNQLFLLKQRSVDMLTLSATERYLALVESQPDIIAHAPLKYIASYLGITDTSLSRIRKEITAAR